MNSTPSEYVLFCDESIRDGPFYSNFYGGVLVPTSRLAPIAEQLGRMKLSLNLYGEVKWTKVTANYQDKYCSLMDAFFDLMEAREIRTRIMFRQNARRPQNLTPLQREQSFYILYYQFIKHAFGFAGMGAGGEPRRLRLYFDQFPDTGEQIARFRGYILGLNHSREFRESNLAIRPEDFTEIRSHDHTLLQCLDVVLGAMAFRLNDLHRARQPGQRARGSRTKAKEQVYRHILERIRRIRPNFNVGFTTGGTLAQRWADPYRHWSFVPSEHEFDRTLTKRRPTK